MAHEICPEGTNFRIAAPNERADAPAQTAAEAAGAALQDLGLAVTLLRTACCLRQEDLARVLGQHQSRVSRIERGAKVFSVESMERQVAAMDLPPWTVNTALAFLQEVRAARSGGGRAWQAAERGGQPLVGAGVRPASVLAREAARRITGEGRGSSQPEREAVRAPSATRRRAEGLWIRLLPYEAGERRAVVRVAAEFQGWALCERVCAESVQAAAHDAAAALELSELAVEIARRAPGEEPWRRRLEGYALAFRANALRVTGRLGAAGEAFEHALAVWESGAPVDPAPLDGTRVLDLEASLRREQRRLDLALALLDRALAEHPTGPAAARLLLNRAHTLEELGDYEGAVVTLYQAAPQIDSQREPRLALILRQQLAWDLCLLGRAAEGEEQIVEARALAEGLGNHLDFVRVRGVEAVVAAGVGRREEAFAAFEEVRSRFAELGMSYDAALATLQLAVLYAAEGGRSAEVKALAAEAAPIFEAEGIPAEARKALVVFARAAAEERVTVELARAVAGFVERVRREPGARVEGGG